MKNENGSNIVVILRGISGCGKSTIARKILGEYESVRIVSADDYFMEGGVYNFDAQKIAEAHLSCFSNFISDVNDEVEIIVVDNTNLRLSEITPYKMYGECFGYEVVVVNVHEFDLGKCWKRCEHGVPYNSIVRQFEVMNAEEMPDYISFVSVSSLFEFLG